MFGGGGFGSSQPSAFGGSSSFGAQAGGGGGGGLFGGGGASNSFGAQSTGGGGLFGGGGNTGSAFGGGGSAFGSNTGSAFGGNSGFGGSSTGAFGSPAPAGGFNRSGTGFGLGTTGNTFGGTSGSTFGGAPGSAFGGTPGSAFGGATTSTFGGGAPASAFGAANPAGGFGTPNPTFGGGATSGFGASNAAGGGGLFGSARPASGTMFGSPQPAAAGLGGGFGTTTTTTGGFGMNPSMGGGFAGGRPAEQHNPANELEIKPEERPTDSITSLRFTPSADPSAQFLCASSWDNSIRVFQHIPNAIQAKAMVQASVPVFDTCFRSDGGAIFAACADGTVQLWNVAAGQNQLQPIGRHDAPCRSVHWIPELNVAVSSGWDKTVRYWDLRQPQPVQVVQLDEKVHAMAVRSNWMVVGCAGPNFSIYLFDLKNPQVPVRQKNLSQGTVNHPKMSMRTAAIATDNSFYCLAGIEGRVHIHYIDESKAKNNFTFRCHKTEDATKTASSLKYHNPINDIQFHPKSNVTATCGSDGSYCYWDIGERSRLHHGPMVSPGMGGQAPQAKKCMFPGGERPAPLLCSAFNTEGSVYAYAVGYDWNAGAQWNRPDTQVNAIVLHYVKPEELKKKRS